MQISDNDYNAARDLLIYAGSKTALHTYIKHTQGAGSSLREGQQLLRAVKDEFRQRDAVQSNLHSDMTLTHREAIYKAADRMRILNW